MDCSTNLIVWTTKNNRLQSLPKQLFIILLHLASLLHLLAKASAQCNDVSKTCTAKAIYRKSLAFAECNYICISCTMVQIWPAADQKSYIFLPTYTQHLQQSDPSKFQKDCYCENNRMTERPGAEKCFDMFDNLDQYVLTPFATVTLKESTICLTLKESTMCFIILTFVWKHLSQGHSHAIARFPRTFSD